MRVACHQPTFLPWPGFWARLLEVDLMIWGTAVQVSSHAGDHYHNRVRMGGSWLTVPLVGAAHDTLFGDLRFERRALPRISKSICTVFGRRYPYGDRARRVAAAIDSYVGGDRLLELNLELLGRVADEMGSGLPTTVIDDQPVDPEASKTERMIERLRRTVTGPVDYYMGRGTAGWVDMGVLRRNAVRAHVLTLPATVGDETVLRLLSESPEPDAVLRTMGSWELVN